MGWFDSLRGVFNPNAPAQAPDNPVVAPAEQACPITMPDLLAAGIERRLAALFLDPLNAAMREFDIVTPMRAAMFIAQVAHESDDFKATAEYWGPTTAQIHYENRKDLGNDKPGAGGPGNGYRWRGHGIIQITGYFNHVAEANYFDIPMEQVSAWLQTPVGACRSAGLYWFTHGCNELADQGDFKGVTRKINGGLNGYDSRLQILKDIAPGLGVDIPE